MTIAPVKKGDHLAPVEDLEIVTELNLPHDVSHRPVGGEIEDRAGK
jgi:hypothetical protein